MILQIDVHNHGLARNGHSTISHLALPLLSGQHFSVDVIRESHPPTNPANPFLADSTTRTPDLLQNPAHLRPALFILIPLLTATSSKRQSQLAHRRHHPHSHRQAHVHPRRSSSHRARRAQQIHSQSQACHSRRCAVRSHCAARAGGSEALLAERLEHWCASESLCAAGGRVVGRRCVRVADRGFRRGSRRVGRRMAAWLLVLLCGRCALY